MSAGSRTPPLGISMLTHSMVFGQFGNFCHVGNLCKFSRFCHIGHFCHSGEFGKGSLQKKSAHIWTLSKLPWPPPCLLASWSATRNFFKPKKRRKRKLRHSLRFNEDVAETASQRKFMAIFKYCLPNLNYGIKLYF